MVIFAMVIVAFPVDEVRELRVDERQLHGHQNIFHNVFAN